MTDLNSAISHHIWTSKYRCDGESRIGDSWRRIASALAGVESANHATWEERFFDVLQDYKFLPGGRIQAGAGSGRNVTLFNCFVMGVIPDSIPGIFQALQEGAVTMQQGGGIGCDFSSLRPRGTHARGVGTIASGPVSFMHLWDSMCATILSTGARRGAMMATMRCDHPDIEEFVRAKQQQGVLRHFNLSVLVTDDFIDAVRADDAWPLVFSAETIDGDGPTVSRILPGDDAPKPCAILRRISARKLWQLILAAAYDHAEPGVLFIDRINRLDNLWYCEKISATNPCGEIPLPPYGACNLGSLNLARFVRDPFTSQASFDRKAIADTVRIAVRMLDNVIDLSRFPLPQQCEQARHSRRIGLGITGLADALLMRGLRYGSEASLADACEIMRLIRDTAYEASVALAVERGSFPLFEREKYLQGPFIRGLPEDLQKQIATKGIRNSHLLAIAPTGTISLLAGNVSSGIEPIYAASYKRKVLDMDGGRREFDLIDYGVALWRSRSSAVRPLPEYFVTAADLPPSDHLAMQAALQSFVDNSISKTINMPADCSFEEFRNTFDIAYDKGLKGCTVFRPNPISDAVLTGANDGADAPHCCSLERETD